MKIHLVGGAVRDSIMHLQVRERDWVVVGATAEELQALGYRRHGASFPVFLNPETAEEYALARTERKTGPGYKGFEVKFDPGVTLEEDLLRRDLTINAMALDGDGRLVDPWGGMRDLRSRTLRAVSSAFVEDPLRVLRLARFAARFADQGFRVAPETLDMMREIVAAGEMEELTQERVWQELERALGESCPWAFFEVLRACGALARIMPQLEALFGRVEQRRDRAPLDAGSGALVSVGFEDRELPRAELAMRRWAALGSCLGGEAEALSRQLGAPTAWRFLAILASRHADRAQAKIGGVGAEALFDLWRDCDFLRRPERLPQLMSAWRAGGRGGDQVWACLPQLAAAAAAVEVGPLVDRGLSKQALGEALAAGRCQAMAEWLAQRN